MPVSEGERATIPCIQEGGKCEAFPDMPSDAFFQSVRSLSFVCYRASEATDKQLQRLLSELPGAGVAVVDLDEYSDFRELPILPRETLLFAGTRETLALAQDTPMATVGYGALAGEPLSPEACGALLDDAEYPVGEACGALRADLLVEGFDEVDVQLLDRIMKRAQGLPWITVVTKRCILREITPGDLDELFALYAQPGITDYTEPLFERAAEEQYTRDYIANMYRFYGYGMWLVFSRENGALIGRAGFSHQDLGDEIVLEMGYIVGVPYQRKGYATEICEKLLAFARENLSDFGSLNCFVEPGNAASHGLMRKLGFSQSGTVKLRGKEMARYFMALSDGEADGNGTESSERMKSR